jgi:hypothetical protein
MIRTALEFIQDELNMYVQKKDPDNFGNKNLATLSGIVKQDGSFEFDSTNSDNDHKIIISLVNIEENKLAENQSYFTKGKNNEIQHVNPAVNLNLYILFSAYSDDYKSSLRNLSYVIGFFQSNSVFTEDHFPQMNAKANKPWQKIEKLLFDMHSLSLEHQNHLWASIGAKYMPSVLYKMSLLRIREMELKAETPPIKEARLDNKNI